MAAAIAFDTHTYVKKLIGVGFSEEQAEVQAETLIALVEDRLVTKHDFEIRITQLETKIERDLKELEMRLVIRLGGLLVVAVGVMTALQKLL